MTGFAIAAFALLVLAVAIVMRPLLKRASGAGVVRERSNLEIHRDQSAELERDLAAGALSAQGYEQAKRELASRVLEEGVASAGDVATAKPAKAAAVVVAVLIPVLATALYLHLGNLQGIGALPHPAADASSVTADQFRQMTANLAARMQANPGDAEGWKMLGRAYRAMEQYADANAAFRRALELRPDDADLLADYAESLALGAGRSMAGEPTKLLERALKLEPKNTKVLALSGSAAFERKDYKAAVGYWEAVLRQPGIESDLAAALQKGVDEAKSRLSGKPQVAAAGGKERVSGEVSLDPALAGKVGPDDAVFVFARAAEGPRMPLAVARITVRELPYRFSFDDASAMMPDMKLSNFKEIVIGARISKSGAATPGAGDLLGQSPKVSPGATGVRVRIDRLAGAS